MSEDQRELDDLPRPARRQADASLSKAQKIRKAMRGRHVCPFCGTSRETEVGACPQCGLEDNPMTRAATRSKLGPWYVVQVRNPAAPGMSLATLLALVDKGKITPFSIIRGPTSNQLWRHAAKVKGVSREFGLCWSCGSELSSSMDYCPACRRSQMPPDDPDSLLETSEARYAQEKKAPLPPREDDDDRMSPVDRLIQSPPIRKAIRRPQVNPPRPPDADVEAEQAADDAFDPADAGQIAELPPRHAVIQQAAETADLPKVDMNRDLDDGLEMAAFQLSGGYSAPSEPGMFRRAMKVTLVAAVVSIGGFAAIVGFDADLRAKYLDHARNIWNQVNPPANAPAASRPAVVVPTTGASSRAASSAVTLSPEDAQDRVWDLWKQAADAEARHDWPAAVRAYQAIKKLPVSEQAWPPELERHLQGARARVQ